MVDVVGMAFALVDADHGADHRDHVVQAQRHQIGVLGLPEPAVQLVAAHPAQVVAPGAEEQVPNQGPGVLQTGRFTRPQAAVEFDLSSGDAPRGVIIEILIFVEPLPERAEVVFLKVQVLGFEDRVLIQGCLHVPVAFIGVDIGEQGHHFIVVGHAQGAEENRRRDLALPVYLDRDDVFGAGLKLKPSATRGDQLGRAEAAVADGVPLQDEIDSRRADQLAYHDALRAVDDKCAVVGHHGDVAHEDLLFLDLAGIFHHQASPHVKGLGVGDLPLLALLRRVFGIAEVMLQEMQLVFIAGIVGDWRDFLIYFD